MAEKPAYREVSPEQGARFFGAPDAGEIIMLNLLRFRDRADYSHALELEPAGGSSGRAAYDRYVEEMTPLLEASGGKVLFSGRAGDFLIGPSDERWDYALLVRQASKAAFLAFATDPQAQRATVHRTAAIADSRLLPLCPE